MIMLSEMTHTHTSVSVPQEQDIMAAGGRKEERLSTPKQSSADPKWKPKIGFKHARLKMFITHLSTLQIHFPSCQQKPSSDPKNVNTWMRIPTSCFFFLFISVLSFDYFSGGIDKRQWHWFRTWISTFSPFKTFSPPSAPRPLNRIPRGLNDDPRCKSRMGQTLDLSRV